MIPAMTPDEWRAKVGVHVEHRRDKVLRLSKREAARRAGISDVVWRQIESGNRQVAPGHMIAPNPEEATRTGVSEALRWTPDSIDRLLAGERAVTWEDELNELQARFDDAAFEVVESGGSEEVRDYVWLWDQVNDKRARLGRDPHPGHPAALPHVAVRGLIREHWMKSPTPALDAMLVDPERWAVIEMKLSQLDDLQATVDRLLVQVQQIAALTLEPEVDDEQDDDEQRPPGGTDAER